MTEGEFLAAHVVLSFIMGWILGYFFGYEVRGRKKGVLQ